MINCNIGVQVRLGSTRLPKKSLLKIDGEAIIGLLLENILASEITLRKKKNVFYICPNTFVLVPDHELKFWAEFIDQFNYGHNSSIRCIPGSEENVFQRFESMHQSGADYIVRITGDCPILPNQLITKAVITGIRHRLDYLSNVDPIYRTAPDGYDIEVISGRAFDWLSEEIENGTNEDREHVTTYLRNNFEKWMRVAILSHPLDLSDLKYSVDTQEDFEEVKRRYESKKNKDRLAIANGWGVYEY